MNLNQISHQIAFLNLALGSLFEESLAFYSMLHWIFKMIERMNHLDLYVWVQKFYAYIPRKKYQNIIWFQNLMDYHIYWLCHLVKRMIYSECQYWVNFNSFWSMQYRMQWNVSLNVKTVKYVCGVKWCIEVAFIRGTKHKM